MGIIFRIFSKSCEEKSKLSEPVREPRKVGGGTVKAAEHGLGAGLSIGRQPRVIPLQMFEVCAESRRLPRQSADWRAMTGERWLMRRTKASSACQAKCNTLLTNSFGER